MPSRVLALAGGGGGARMAHGLALVLEPGSLTIVVNTGDDDRFHGLHVSPDLDSVMYTLAGEINPTTGWGLRDETYRVREALGLLGSETWFTLGDRDLATHLRRTELLAAGHTLSQATEQLRRAYGVEHPVVPMTDDPVRTLVETDDGEIRFQEYFVRLRHEPRVRGLRFEGAETAAPSTALHEALEAADAVVISPSNPFLSIAPILALPGIRERLTALQGPRIVVSPIIGGEAVRGPAARLFQDLAGETASAVAVARHYRGLGTHFVMDERDGTDRAEVESLGYAVTVTPTLMTGLAEKRALATVVCGLVGVAA